MSVTAREDDDGASGPLAPVDRLQAPRGRRARLRLAVPVAGVLAGLLALYLLLEGTFRVKVFTFLGTYILPGGIDYGIPLARGLGLTPLWIVGLITYFDLWVTLFWVWNLDHLARWKWMRDRIDKSRSRAHRLWERFPRLRVVSGPGLALFILLPIPWTGSFAGVAVGKLLDLPDRVVYFASISGTLVRVTVFALFWDALIGML